MTPDLTNQRFGRLVAREQFRQIDSIGKNREWWKCVCDCGKEHDVRRDALLDSIIRSCGCLHVEDRRTRRINGSSPEERGPGSTYSSWASIRVRLRDKKSAKWYSDKGITVCERWKSYRNFLSDMGPRPSPIHTLDRIDCNGNYEPGNCRWATPTEQGRNKGNSVTVVINGNRINALEFVERYLSKIDADNGRSVLQCLLEQGIRLFVSRRQLKYHHLDGGWSRRTGEG